MQRNIYFYDIRCTTNATEKTLELVTAKGQFNNAAALLADQNPFKGIDIIRFGSTIFEIKDRKILENVSILTQFYETLNTFLQYYQYEKIDGAIRKKVELIQKKLFVKR